MYLNSRCGGISRGRSCQFDERSIPSRCPIRIHQSNLYMMGKAHWHTFQILTKRSERLVELAGKVPWHNNMWMGVSVENADYTYRIEHLQKVSASVRFLSVEPLLGPIPRLPLQGIHWVIVGGESGPGARNMDPRWVRKIRDRCIAQGVPFFFKQWGGTRKKLTGRELDGRTWDEMPASGSENSKRVSG